MTKQKYIVTLKIDHSLYITAHSTSEATNIALEVFGQHNFDLVEVTDVDLYSEAEDFSEN